MELAVIDTRYGEAVGMELVASDADVNIFVKKAIEALSGQVEIDTDNDIYFAVIDGKPVLFEQD